MILDALVLSELAPLNSDESTADASRFLFGDFLLLTFILVDFTCDDAFGDFVEVVL